MLKKICLLLMCFGMVCLTSCEPADTSSQIKSNGQVKYSTSNQMSNTDYAMYVSQESMTIINQLSTRMDLGLKVVSNQYPYEDELKNTKSSLVIVEDAIENVTVTNPPVTFVETREDILRVMANTKSSLEAYQKALEKKDAVAINTAIKLMSADASSLTAYMNLAYN